MANEMILKKDRYTTTCLDKKQTEEAMSGNDVHELCNIAVNY